MARRQTTMPDGDMVNGRSGNGICLRHTADRQTAVMASRFRTLSVAKMRTGKINGTRNAPQPMKCISTFVERSSLKPPSIGVLQSGGSGSFRQHAVIVRIANGTIRFEDT
jgi:hypothetical protein